VRESPLSAALGSYSGRVPQNAPMRKGQPGQPMMPADNDRAQQQDPSLLLAMLAGQDQSGMPPQGQRQ
jgi:hypothetical protein